jgi:hypothetical protein
MTPAATLWLAAVATIFVFNAITDAGVLVAGANVPPLMARDVIDAFTGLSTSDLIDISAIRIDDGATPASAYAM